MESITENVKPSALEKDMGIWLDILKLWRSHLAFLNTSLRSMHQNHPDLLDGQSYDEVSTEMQNFSDSVLSDYLEVIGSNLDVKEKEPVSLSESKWLQEYDLIEQDMKLLRSEYKKLLVKGMAVLA
jgi:hypothetical protein